MYIWTFQIREVISRNIIPLQNELLMRNVEQVEVTYLEVL